MMRRILPRRNRIRKRAKYLQRCYYQPSASAIVQQKRESAICRKNFMLSALTVSPICGNAMILLPNCESAQTPHVFNNPYKENSP